MHLFIFHTIKIICPNPTVFLLMLGVFILSFKGIAQTDSNYQQLWQDLLVLSHDSLSGRKTGTQGNLKAQRYITNRFKQAMLQPAGEGFAHRFLLSDSTIAANLVGVVKGQSELMIILSAHYDHLGEVDGQVYNGADDNASGVSVLLLMADHFAQNTPQHTMIFIAFDAEEQGLLGAQAFLENAPIDLQKLALNVNLDMVSRGDQNELFASGTYHNPGLRPILQRAGKGSPISLLFGHDNPSEGHNDWTLASDHGPFHQNGYPHLYFGVEDHPDYHKPTDDAEKVNREFFYHSAELILNSVKELDQNWEWIKPKN